MPRGRKKLSEINIADGKERRIPRDLNEVWGEYKPNPYGTQDEDKYRQSLSIMNKVDLQRACIAVGLYPNDSRETMVDRLLREFKKYTASVLTSQLKPQPITASENVRKMLQRMGGNNVV